MIGASVAVCWGKVMKYAKKSHVSPDDVAKIVAIHELAHLISHQGLDKEGGSNWSSFDKVSPNHEPIVAPSLKEIVAQMATDDLVELHHKELRDTFNKMLDGQHWYYTAHKRVKKTVLDAEAAVNKTDSYSEDLFWRAFRASRNSKECWRECRDEQAAIDIFRVYGDSQRALNIGNPGVAPNF